MRALVGVRDPTGHLLWVLMRSTHKRKHRDRGVTQLLGQPKVINTPPIDARWRAGLQSAHRQPQLAQVLRQPEGRRVTRPPRLIVGLSDMDQAGQKGPRCQHHRFCDKA